MRVTLVAPVASGAMKQYVEQLANAMEPLADVTLVAPRHYSSENFKGKISHLSSPLNRRARGLYWLDPFAQRKACQTILATQPDVVHLCNGQGYLFSAMLRSMLPKTVPYLVTVHDPVAHGGSVADAVLYAVGRRLTLHSADSLHAFSRFAAEQLVQQGFDHDAIFVTRHGSLERTFSQHNLPGIQREDRALFFGRWEHYKGIDLLVDAVLNLAADGIPMPCILAGPGSVPAGTYRKIKQHPNLFEIHNRYLGDAEVANLFQRTNATLLPYRDATQSSLPAIAAAYGHKILATQVGALAEEVSALGGILVEPGSTRALADGLRKLRDVPAANPALLDYSWESVATGMLNRYRKLKEQLSYQESRRQQRT